MARKKVYEGTVPKARTPEAYRDWIVGIMRKINPGYQDTHPIEWWAEHARKFWAKFDKGQRRARTND
jgi:hypothetical protein